MNLKTRIVIIFLVTVMISCTKSPVNEIDLSGQWLVKLDSLHRGIDEKWAATIPDGTNIQLPGILDNAELGKQNTLVAEMNNNTLSGLTRRYQYIGPAWYQRKIDIPEDWTGKDIILELERVIWESQVFIDGIPLGKAESLSTPHRYIIDNDILPGKHILTIRIDNSNLYPLINVKGNKYPDPVNQDLAHAYTNHTQIKWNGIVGDIKIVASEKHKIRNLRVFSDVARGTIRAAFNNNAEPGGKLSYQILYPDGKIIVEGKIDERIGELTIKTPGEIELWDEFNPKLYTFKIISEKDGYTETTSTRFGYRQILKNKEELSLNGKRIFLRGNLECAIFPLEGHPPTNREAWVKLISQAKAYGLNHIRFHSWCPPKAAFEAADEIGFYFQVELPHWSLNFGQDSITTEYLIHEADKILMEYGNHPSFLLMSLGNELQGNRNLMNSSVAYLREKDNRHLYTTTTFSFQYPLGRIAQPEDDFFITQRTDKGWIRGQGIFNSREPGFNQDYSENCDHVPVPLISHEIGQYSVFPDISEIEKYTGVLIPLNFIAIKNELEKKGMLHLADDFKYASGKLAAMLYKEEIERALKTASFDGFQLLQLQDFPGQGTALVGLLNAFWESKGVISSEEFRKFNSELVPLIRFDKAVYENGEIFKFSLEIANFYKELRNQTITWSIKNENKDIIAQESIYNIDIQYGNNTQLGEYSFLVETDKAQKYKVEVAVEDTPYRNSWPLWVYPESVETESKKIFISSSVDEARNALQEGKTVLLNPDYRYIKGVEGRFVPVFWSPVHFPDQPGTMGILVDPSHPAFYDFPTSSFTEWQWWDLMIHSKSVIIDSLNVTPIVRVIDNFVTNHHLANVFEAKAGSGKIVFSSIDLSTKLYERPVARQLRSSLLKYMESEEFNPSGSLDIDELDSLYNNDNKEFKTTYIDNN